MTPGQRRNAAAIAAVGAPVIAAVGSTYRWSVEGYQHYEAILASGKQPIFGFWHGRILPATLFWKHKGIVVITSQNFDGEWIAGIIRRFGYGTARGSTSRGGARALVQLRRDLSAGKPVGFTLDGPRGPAQVAQPGAIFLAGATGNPILPFHIEAGRSWTMRSWDRTQVPKPFSRVAVVVAEPLWVGSTSEESIEEGCRRVEGALERSRARAVDILGSRAPL